MKLLDLFLGGGGVIPWDAIIKTVGACALIYFIATRVLGSIEDAHAEKTEALLDKQQEHTEVVLKKAELDEMRIQRDLAVQGEQEARAAQRQLQVEFEAERKKFRNHDLVGLGSAKPRTLTRLSNAATGKKLETIRSRHRDFQSQLSDLGL